MIFKKPEEGLAYAVPEFSVRGNFAATLAFQRVAKIRKLK